MVEKRKPIDWEAVEADFRAGILSLRVIASQFDITEGAIRKKAKAEGWTRSLLEKVRQAAQEKLVRTDGTQSSTQQKRLSDAQVTDNAAEVIAAVVRDHRGRIGRGQKIVDGMFSELEAMPDAILKDKAMILSNLAGSLKTFVGLERQAYNLGDGTSGDAPPEPIARIERVIYRPSDTDR